MQEIVDRYNIPESPYLLPIIVKSGVDERKQYINASHRINRHFENYRKRIRLIRSFNSLRSAPFLGQRSPE